MKKIVFFIALMIVSVIQAQVPFESMAELQFMTPAQQYRQNDEKTIERLQAYYIEMFLTKPMMMVNDELFSSEEDSDYNMKMQSDFMKEMLAKELAKKLAEEDILKFKKLFLRNSEALGFVTEK